MAKENIVEENMVRENANRIRDGKGKRGEEEHEKKTL